MKFNNLAVVGSRFKDDSEEEKTAAEEALVKILDRFHAKYKSTWFISGGAEGVDSWAEEWSKTKKMSRQIFIPDWYPDGKYDRGAGFKRNKDIVEAADFVIAFTNGSNGTANSIEWAERLKKPLTVFDETGKLIKMSNLPNE